MKREEEIWQDLDPSDLKYIVALFKVGADNVDGVDVSNGLNLVNDIILCQANSIDAGDEGFDLGFTVHLSPIPTQPSALLRLLVESPTTWPYQPCMFPSSPTARFPSLRATGFFPPLVSHSPV
ncbi:hypothetical protein RHGRI_026136 [Rhododendron griersonianum]|uniref:Uncharacterized protein n=1 Tax=Rhododendron griersonianum TaxID=479676 RepID=A0AAV6IV95_9ERIC|nr:hypothetical protein RHGRI_026136 [Rhododendron griersonianum]